VLPQGANSVFVRMSHSSGQTPALEKCRTRGKYNISYFPTVMKSSFGDIRACFFGTDADEKEAAS